MTEDERAAGLLAPEKEAFRSIEVAAHRVLGKGELLPSRLCQDD